MMAATTSRLLELGVSNPNGIPAPTPAAGKPGVAEADGLTLLASVLNGAIKPPSPPDPPPLPIPPDGMEPSGFPPPPAPAPPLREYCRLRSSAPSLASSCL